MTHRVSAGGSFRLDKVFPQPVGRLALASGATTKTAYKNVVACLDRLAERGRLDVLGALKSRQVSVAQVLDADRRGELDRLLAADHAPLWPAIKAWLGPVNGRSLTVGRYGNSWDKLERLGMLAPDAPVSALERVDWKGLSKRWPGSAADYNHARRAVSRFLTCHLGDKYHPLRRRIMNVETFPKLAEEERVPDLDVPTFWRVVEAAPEHVRASFVCIVALGLRLGEFLRLRETDLHPITRTVSVPGTKTAGSLAVLRVADALWPWVVAAVPAKVGKHRLWSLWKASLKAVGADSTLRIHDLRHLTAQLLVNAGQSEASVQSTMRHATASMTRRYARQKDRGENAAALARVLLQPKSA